MTERRMKSSNPEYQEMNLLQTLLHWLTNPQALFWPEGTYDLPEPERKALIEKLKDQQQEYIDLGPFSDHLNKKP